MAEDVWEFMEYDPEEDDRDREEVPDPGSGILQLIDTEYFYDLLMEQQEYDLSKQNEVRVTVYGKVLNETYMHILFDRPDLDLQTVYLLDQVQKGESITLEAAHFLRKHKLIEGRYPNIYLSVGVAKTTSQEAQYIKNKGFDDQYYRDLIVDYLKNFGKGKRKDFRELLWDKLPDTLDDKKKTGKY